METLKLVAGGNEALAIQLGAINTSSGTAGTGNVTFEHIDPG